MLSATPGAITTPTATQIAAAMPNQPRPDNPARPIRVEDDLWEAARLACDQLGTTRAEVMREALRQVVARAEEAG